MNFSMIYQKAGGMFRIRKIFPGEFTYVAPPTTPRLTQSSNNPYTYPLFHILFPLSHTSTSISNLSTFSSPSSIFIIYLHFIHTLFTHSHPIYGIITYSQQKCQFLPYSTLLKNFWLNRATSNNFLYKHELAKNKFNIMEAIIL